MWIRQAEVITGNKKFVNYGKKRIEIDFDIPFSTNKEPDISEIDLYNLSESTINQIRDEGYIYVNAGYRDLQNIGNLLVGKIEDVTSTWEGTEKITKILASDGAKDMRNVEIEKTYAENTTSKDIMTDLSNLLGYNIIAINPVENKIYKRGKAIKGKAYDILKELATDTKSKMFIDKNSIVIRDDEVGENVGFTLNKRSGLIGSPEKEVDESDGKQTVYWRIKALLNSKFKTDAIINIESEYVKGQFRIVEGRHTGDFETELKVKGV